MKKALQTYILKRYVSDDRIGEMIDEYNSNRKGTGSEKRVVCQLDRIIYTEQKRGMTVQQLAAKYQRSFWWIYKSIALADREEQESKSNIV